MGLSVSKDLGLQLHAYYGLLTTWNERINLSGFTLSDTPPEAIDRLIVEPLVAATHVAPGVARIVDIGSGGGSPAIPLALGFPGVRLLLVEAKTRKAVFLREALRAVGLDSAEVITARFEELLARPELHEMHDLLTVRAVRVERRVLMGLQAFVKPGGQVFLFQGTTVSRGEAEVVAPLVWQATYPLSEWGTSRLVVLAKKQGRH
jgi:16S rRNA (guanine527-N7)-methyltransferase